MPNLNRRCRTEEKHGEELSERRLGFLRSAVQESATRNFPLNRKREKIEEENCQCLLNDGRESEDPVRDSDL